MITRCLAAAAFALAAVASTSAVADPVIRVGTYTASTTSPFVVPVLVSGAAGLGSFSFDLTYDAHAYQIDTTCDPFADAACDLFTGPVTLGTFYTGAESMPALFNPGFVITDAGGAQTGLLSGVNGAWQDFFNDPPSGDGVLAFIEFTATGAAATAPISVVGQPAVTTPVPEPASAWLLLAGLAVAGVARLRRARA